MNYLGIDYGLRKVGLAISEGQIASPLKVIEISGLNDAVSKIMQVIKQEDTQRVVIGVPESGEAKNITKKFSAELKAKLNGENVSVIETEETLSSHEAQDLMIDLGVGQKERRKEDAYAATIILQKFIDSLP